MKKHLIAVAVCALATSAFAQSTQDGAFMVRARAVSLTSANKDTTGLGLTINNKWIPEVDVSYFFTPNFAAELILTVPQKQVLSSNGTAIGNFSHLPPTLLGQYHFNLGPVKPYVGAGLNYTIFSSVNLPAGVDIKRHSVGGALQVGMDIPVDKNWSINLDVKKVYIGTDVTAGGAKIGTFKADPVLFGLGVGYRF